MTDFLTRLAERTLGVAPVVQPLIASRFAPGSAIVGDALLGYAQPTEEEADRTETQGLSKGLEAPIELSPLTVQQEALPASPTPAPPSRDASSAYRRAASSPGAPRERRSPAPALPRAAADDRPSPARLGEPDAGPAETAPPVLVPKTPHRETGLAGLPQGHVIEPPARGPETALSPAPPARRRAAPGAKSPPAQPVGSEAERRDRELVSPAQQDAPPAAMPAASQPPTPDATRAARPRRTAPRPTRTARAGTRPQASPTPLALEPLVRTETGPSPAQETLSESSGGTLELQETDKPSRPQQRRTAKGQPGIGSDGERPAPAGATANVAGRREPPGPARDEREAALPVARPGEASRPSSGRGESPVPRPQRPGRDPGQEESGRSWASPERRPMPIIARPAVVAGRESARPTPEGRDATLAEPTRPTHQERATPIPELRPLPPSQHLLVPAVAPPDAVPFQDSARPLPEGRRAARPTPPPSPPTVQVTIGRVEVRAVHPEPPPSMVAPVEQGPALSLDDYLRQRSEELR